MANPSSYLPDLDAMMDLTARFDAARADDPAMSGAHLDEMLRFIPGHRAILSGTFQGHNAVFRMFLQPDTRNPGREWAELTRIWPAMKDGPYRTAQPLHHCEAHHLLVIEAVTGTPLMEHIRKQPADQRANLMHPPANWLRQYTLVSERSAPAKARIWLARAEAACAQQTHAILQSREQQVLHHLRRLAKPAAQNDWRFAISHGDFHPNNLLYDAPRLTGIDTGGSGSLPIYKDMARFLVHLGRRGHIPSGRARFGVDQQGIEAFSTAFDLTAQERDLVLPFMIGVEALLRVEAPGLKSNRISRAADMYDLLIADLAQL